MLLGIVLRVKSSGSQVCQLSVDAAQFYHLEHTARKTCKVNCAFGIISKKKVKDSGWLSSSNIAMAYANEYITKRYN